MVTTKPWHILLLKLQGIFLVLGEYWWVHSDDLHQQAGRRPFCHSNTVGLLGYTDGPVFLFQTDHPGSQARIQHCLLKDKVVGIPVLVWRQVLEPCVHLSQWLVFCSVSWSHATFQVYLQVSSHTLVNGSLRALRGSGQGLNRSFHWFSVTWSLTPMSLWSIPLSRQIRPHQEGWVTIILLVCLVVTTVEGLSGWIVLSNSFWFELLLFFQTSCTFSYYIKLELNKLLS